MTALSKGRNAALGVRCHSGWGAAILACRGRDAVTILDRRRLQLCDAAVEGAKQPYHHAEPMSFMEAESFIDSCRKKTEALVRAAIVDVKGVAAREGRALTSCTVLSASGRKLPPLNNILTSHALIHAAEGEFYRAAVAAACERAGIAVLRVREADVWRQASDQIGMPEGELNERIISIGKALGPPWTADEKLASLGAWLALSS